VAASKSGIDRVDRMGWDDDGVRWAFGEMFACLGPCSSFPIFCLWGGLDMRERWLFLLLLLRLLLLVLLLLLFLLPEVTYRLYLQ
jgi:hypothetical protein